jgi:HD-GYP domain-containing protein (c-di-GMP phosphodiesterase class II)
MPTLATLLTDKTFLQKAFSYLETYHGVRAVVVDKDGQIDLWDDGGIREFSEKRFFPVAFEEDIGGIRCSAETADILEKAIPHIQLCVDGLQRMIEKAVIMQQTMDEMLHLSDQLHFLLGFAGKLGGIHDPQQYCQLVLSEISQIIDADAAFAYIREKKDSPAIISHRISPENIVGLEGDPKFQSLSEDKTAVIALGNGTSVLVAPIKEKEEYIGHVAFLRGAEKHVFTAYDKQFVGIINSIISPTMETLVLYHSLHLTYLNTVKALAAAIDAKDAYTHGHSFRVARYSVSIAKRLDISPSALDQLEIAAYMHDLGKIGISEAILGKRGRLSTSEFEEIKKHPVLTNKILEPIDLPEFIISATLQHHERLDGSGYPLGLKGNNISLFARIIAVADVFDALTSARPYRDALTVEDALTALCRGIDSAYDRNVVYAFISALRDNVTDQDLSSVYSGLKFMRLDKMNQFLEQLTNHLIRAPKHSD